MPSNPSFIAGVGLAATLTAFFIGLALAVGILALLRQGDGRGVHRVSLIIVVSSFAIATGAWVFVLAARNGLGFPDILWYALAGLLIGLFGSLFPRLVGIPVLTLAVLGVLLCASELAAWHPWQDGLRIVELKIYAADEDSSLCGLSMADRNAVPVLQNLRLASGSLVLRIDVLAVNGPLAFLFGARHYRLLSLGVDMATAAGSTAVAPAVHVFPFRQGILDGRDKASPVAGFIGISRRRLRSEALPAEDLAQASYFLQADGSLTSVIR